MAGSLSVEIAKAVADAEGVDPWELDYVLEDYVDTDALDRMAACDGGAWTLSFELPGHEVTVTSRGLITVDGVVVTDAWMDRGDEPDPVEAD